VALRGWRGMAWVVSGVVSGGLLLALMDPVAKPPWLWVECVDVVGGWARYFNSPMKGNDC